MPDFLPPSNTYQPPNGVARGVQRYQPPVAAMLVPASPTLPLTPAQPVAVAPPPTPSNEADRVLSEWRIHHGDAWVRSDALHREVRRLLDPRERAAAIRQRVQQLGGVRVGGFCVESRVIGNPIRHRLYRVVEAGERPSTC
jgi:hypothetical protein